MTVGVDRLAWAAKESRNITVDNADDFANDLLWALNDDGENDVLWRALFKAMKLSYEDGNSGVNYEASKFRYKT